MKLGQELVWYFVFKTVSITTAKMPSVNYGK